MTQRLAREQLLLKMCGKHCIALARLTPTRELGVLHPCE